MRLKSRLTRSLLPLVPVLLAAMTAGSVSSAQEEPAAAEDTGLLSYETAISSDFDSDETRAAVAAASLLVSLQAEPLDSVGALFERARKDQERVRRALNALGYSWTERNIRMPEAQELITKALNLTPEDPFIMDSMGWVLYRQGKLTEALQTLENAFRLKADPEIAAHLGEVLWSLERKDEARRILKDAYQAHPENETLASTVKKLLP